MRKLKLVIALGWTITILISCLTSNQTMSGIGLSFAGYDKFVHIGIYFVLTLLWLLYYSTTNNFKKIYIYIAITIFCYGVLIEVLQELLTKDRSADLLDVLANTFGIILATFVFFIYNKQKKR